MKKKSEKQNVGAIYYTVRDALDELGIEYSFKEGEGASIKFSRENANFRVFICYNQDIEILSFDMFSSLNVPEEKKASLALYIMNNKRYKLGSYLLTDDNRLMYRITSIGRSFDKHDVMTALAAEITFFNEDYPELEKVIWLKDAGQNEIAADIPSME